LLPGSGSGATGETFIVQIQTPVTQPAELRKLADLTRYWNPDWTLDRADFGGAGGGIAGIRGITYVDGGAQGSQGRKWEEVKVDLSVFAGQLTHLRLYQRVLVPNRVAGNAYWKAVKVEC